MRQRAPRCSVIVPLYNMGKYLPECLASLGKQGDVRLEVVIVDDCSTDDSLQIAQREAERNRHLHIRVLQQERNGGVSQARNRGLEEVTGEYVTFLDPDDLLAPGAIGSMLNLAYRERADIVAGNYVAFHQLNGECVFRRYAGFEQEAVFAYEVAGRLWQVPRIVYAASACSKLFRRRFLDEHALRFPIGVSLGEDHMFSVASFSRSHRVAIHPRVAYHYRKGVSHSATAGRYTLQHFRCIQRLAASNVPQLHGWPKYYYSRRVFDYEVLQNVRRLAHMQLHEARAAFELLAMALAELDDDACRDFVCERPWAKVEYRDLKNGNFARCWARHSLSKAVGSIVGARGRATGIGLKSA